MTSQTGGFFVVLTRLRFVMQNFGEARREVINMAPEIWRGEKLVANVPDETGMHKTLSGKPLYVNVDLLDAFGSTRIELEAEEIGGKRAFNLDSDGTGEGRGSEKKSKPPIRVVLLERPICEINPDAPDFFWEPDGDPKCPSHHWVINPRWDKNRGHE